MDDALLYLCLAHSLTFSLSLPPSLPLSLPPLPSLCLFHSLSPSSSPQLGGVQLDKDTRTLVGYLSAQTQWPVRDKFARLTQIITILSLDTVSVA